MKVYIIYEFADYGLWDMSKSKVFLNKEDAEAYSNEHFKERGYALDIAEYDVE